MRRFFVLFFAITSCVTPDPTRVNNARAAKAAEVTGCPEIKTEGDPMSQNWTATGCGRQWNCQIIELPGVGNYEARCEPTAADQRKLSEAAAIQRLALDTGCPADKIAVIARGDLVNNGERVARYDACGKPFVCATRTGSTECKPALGAASQPSQN